jgi:Putative MetA-pathway of phenol degradation
MQGQAPFVDKEFTTLAAANTTRNDGLGDSFVQAALSHPIDSQWAYGFGARLEAPTGGDTLGTGKWQIMPGFGVRYAFLEIGPDTYFVPVLRWALSFSGNPAKPTINQPQIAPTLNIGLPQHWFVI